MAASNSSGATSFALFLARLALGSYCALSGFAIFHGVGGGAFTDQHLPQTMEWLPETMARSYLTVLPYAQIAAGLMVAVGFLTRLGAVVIALVQTTFLMGFVGSGFFFDPRSTTPFPQAVVLIALALLIAVTGAGNTSFDRRAGGGKKSKASASED